MFGLRQHFFRDVAEIVTEALIILVPENGFHLNEIYHTLEFFFRPVGELNGHRVRTETVPDLIDHAQEISSSPVHLVDEHDAWYFITVSLAPDRFGLRLDT